MNKLKQFIVSIALSILMLLSLGFVLWFGGISADRVTGGKLMEYFHKTNLYIAEDAERIIANRLYELVREEDYNAIRDYAKEYGFSFSISLLSGRPVINNMSSKDVYRSECKFYYYSPDELEDSSDGMYSESFFIKVIKPQKELSRETVFMTNSFFYFYDRLYFAIPLALIAIALLWVSLYMLLINASVLYKLCIAVFAVGALESFLIMNYCSNYSSMLIKGLIIEKIALLGVLCFYLVHLRKLQAEVKRIGDIDWTGEDEEWKYPISMRPFANDISCASVNLKAAVSEKIKSERLKTELISNVSHDIKTPLTSIINFSDLIRKEQSDNENITEYAEHLYNQSIRMKDMMEALIEATKASNGAVEINKVPCNVETLLDQCVVEYEAKLEKNGIILVKNPVREEMVVSADVNALSRIFDNLLTNICKYGMPGSRAYIDAERMDDNVVISFKNVSKEAINISPEELKERFVRGDISRHSEGHGLGLSIVHSLMELMDGRLELAAGSDLFEAKLIFPIEK